MQSLRCPFLTFAALLVALASTYVLRYGSLAARAAVLPEERQAWAKGAELRANAKGAKPGRGCCAESLELQLPELPRGHLKVKWRKASVKPGDVMEILVVNDTKSGSKAKGSNGSMASCDRDPFTCKGVEVTNVFVWLVSSDTHQLSADVATPVGPGRWSARVGPLEPGKWMAHALAIITFQEEVAETVVAWLNLSQEALPLSFAR
ncbi:unnamed protein product [Durusdinium trenchii]|uniref:Uncharacterized protein n=1 Tax=Durusdinium trenchii TaxID=1381693 RepID=A0ABP0SFR0_9DINO